MTRPNDKLDAATAALAGGTLGDEWGNVTEATAKTLDENPNAAGAIPFMITKAMRADLAARGLSAAQISDLTPAQAHEIMSQPAAPPPLPEKSGAYAQVGARFIERGYCALRVPRGLKHPNIKDWLLTYTHRKPTQKEINEWSASDAGVGFVTGPASADVVAIDIDTDDPAIIAAILAVLPTNGRIVKKRGKKGATVFVRGPGIMAKAFNIGGVRICDLLANGRFCVLPATIHPETNQPYHWLTTDTLENTDPSELPEVRPDISERLAAALVPFGYMAELEKVSFEPDDYDGGGNLCQRLNAKAMANFDAWVPALNLHNCRRKTGGYEAVANWIPSGQGRPDSQRPRNLSIHKKGIVDFGDGDHPYSPIDLVMAALDYDFDSAFSWLEDRVDPSDVIIDIKPKAKSAIVYASLNEAEAAARTGQRAVMYASGAYGVVLAAAQTKTTAEIIALFPERKPNTERPADDAGEEPKQSSAGPTFSWSNPDPHYLGTGRSTPPAFPLDVLDPSSRKWCEAQALCKSTAVDHSAVALLTCAAGATLNRRSVKVGSGWLQPTILWAVSIAYSGEGKTPCQDPVVQCMRALDAEAYNLALPQYKIYLQELKKFELKKQAWEANYKRAFKANPDLPLPEFPSGAVAPTEVALPQTVITDTTPEALGRLMSGNPNGLLMYNTELSGWWGGMDRYTRGAAERPMWLQAYDGGAYTINRVANPLPYRIPRFSCGILGGTQPDKISDLLKAPDDGLIHRFLLSWPDPVPGISVYTGEIDNKALLAALRRISQLDMARDMKGDRYPVEIPLSPDAADLFLTFRRCNKAKAIASDGPMRSTLSKADGHVPRLAMVLSLLEWAYQPGRDEPNRIEAIYIERAIRLVAEYFQPHAERVFTESQLPVEDSKAGKLAKWVRNKESRTFNAREVRRQLFGGTARDTENMEAACQHLVDAGLIRPVGKTRRAKNGGVTASLYEANPAIW